MEGVLEENGEVTTFQSQPMGPGPSLCCCCCCCCCCSFWLPSLAPRKEATTSAASRAADSVSSCSWVKSAWEKEETRGGKGRRRRSVVDDIAGKEQDKAGVVTCINTARKGSFFLPHTVLPILTRVSGPMDGGGGPRMSSSSSLTASPSAPIVIVLVAFPPLLSFTAALLVL